jgi:hypothetical protein
MEITFADEKEDASRNLARVGDKAQAITSFQSIE